METDESDVERLARAAADGDAAALDALLEAVEPEILRLCGRFLSRREDAEDACQETLLAVSRGITGFEGRSTFRTWLYRLTANRARSTYQALRRRMDSESTGDSMPDAPDWRRTSVVAGARLDLLEALEHLGGEVGESVALRDVMGLSYREIAELQRIPEGTVKSRIHDARKRLRHLLRPADGA